jgi:nitrous oxidase accessory protein NosD
MNNNTYGVYLRSDASVNVLNNILKENTEYGVWFNSADTKTVLNSNTFDGNNEPILLNGKSVGQDLGSNIYNNAPKAFINGHIDTNATMQWRGVPYVINGSTTVDPSVTLTISPDVIIKLKSTQGMSVKGTLEVNATAGHEVYFTSYTDDSVGGDSNEDNDTTTPAPNYWSCISIADNASATIQHAVIRYGGYYSWVYKYGVVDKTGDNGTLVMRDSNVTDSALGGIRVYNAHNANRFEHIFVARSNPGFQADNALFDINGSTFSECTGNGAVYALNSSEGNITETVAANSTYGLYANASHSLYVSGSDFSANSKDGIYNKTGAITITHSTLSNNDENGLTLDHTTDANITDTTIEGNHLNGLNIIESTGNILDNTIASNIENGIYLTGTSSTPEILRNVIKHNRIGIKSENGANPLVGGSVDNTNDIFSNTSYGLQNLDASVLIMARYNYWGDPTGPDSPANPTGKGDRVSDQVNIAHPLTKPRTEMAIMRISQDILDFKTVTKDTASDALTLQVQNIGNIGLDIDNITLNGLNAASYSIESDECGGHTIPVDTNCSVSVTLHPDSFHAQEADFTLNTNDEEHPNEYITLNGVGAHTVPFVDDMNTSSMPDAWLVTNEDATYYYRNDSWEKESALRIYTSDTSPNANTNNMENLFTLPLDIHQQQEYYVQTHISFDTLPTQNYQQGGILIMADSAMQPDMDNYLRLAVAYKDDGIYAIVTQEVNGSLTTLFSQPLSISPEQTVTLRIEKHDNLYTFRYSLDNERSWNDIIEITIEMEAAYAGLYAINGEPSSATRIPVDFYDFYVEDFSDTPAPPIVMPPIYYLLF